MYQQTEERTSGRLMTVGELARRTGMSAKAIRQFEGPGLLQRRPQRGELPPLRGVGDLVHPGDRKPPLARSTIKEIQRLAAVYLDRPGEPIGPRLAELLQVLELRDGLIVDMQDYASGAKAVRALHRRRRKR